MKDIKQKLENVSYYLGFLCLVVLFIHIVIYTNSEIQDPDIWLHLKTGQLILQNGSVPQFDPFSFTLQKKAWLDHEWLFQVIVYLVYHYFGAAGLISLQSISICLMFMMLLFFGTRRDNHFIILTVLLIVLFASQTRINIRPDIFSVLFFMINIFMLKKYLNSKLIYLLIPIQILWANVHGYFIFGPLVVITILIGEFIQTKIPFFSKKIIDPKIIKTKIFRLSLILFLLVIGSFLNPYTYQGAFYPIKIMLSSIGRSKILFENIIELISPVVLHSKYHVNFSIYFFMIIFSLSTFIINMRRIKVTDLMLWIFLLIFSLRFSRNVMFFVMFSGIACIENLNDIDEMLRKKKLTLIRKDKDKIKYLIAVILMILFIFWISKNSIEHIFNSGYYLFDKYEMKGRLWGLSEKEYPMKAVDFILENNLPAKLFNDFNSGSYLIGRCYPQRQVFIDGRTELYGPIFFREYEKVMNGDRPTVERVVKEYGIEGFFITGIQELSLNNIIKYLYHNNEYKTIYFDENAIIFLRETPKNQDLIKKFSFDLRNWRAPEVDLLKIGAIEVVPYPYTRRARFLEMLALDQATISELEQIQMISPDSLIYHSMMGKIFYREKQFLKAFQHFRLALLISPQNTNTRIELTSCYAELGQINKAASELKKILKQDPQNHKAYYRLGLAYDKVNAPKDAIKYLKEALKLEAKIGAYHQDLARIYYKNKDYKNALKEWEELLKLEPDNSEAVINIKNIKSQL